MTSQGPPKIVQIHMNHPVERENSFNRANANQNATSIR